MTPIPVSARWKIEADIFLEFRPGAAVIIDVGPYVEEPPTEEVDRVFERLHAAAWPWLETTPEEWRLNLDALCGWELSELHGAGLSGIRTRPAAFDWATMWEDFEKRFYLRLTFPLKDGPPEAPETQWREEGEPGATPKRWPVRSDREWFQTACRLEECASRLKAVQGKTGDLDLQEVDEDGFMVTVSRDNRVLRAECLLAPTPDERQTQISIDWQSQLPDDEGNSAKLRMLGGVLLVTIGLFMLIAQAFSILVLLLIAAGVVLASQASNENVARQKERDAFTKAESPRIREFIMRTLDAVQTE